MSRTVVGIDIAKDTFDVVLLHQDREHAAQFVNNSEGFWKLRKWLKKKGVKAAHICLEATGLYGDELADDLHQAGYDVSVVNPARIKDYAKSLLSRNKTDRADARIIADFCLRQEPPLWAPPSPEWRELQAMVRHLEDLLEMRQQEKNRLQSGVTSEAVIKTLEEHIQFLDSQIDTLKQQVQSHIDRHPELKKQQDLLTSIKGIGQLSAAKLLGEIRDILAFDNPRQLVAYAGLNPKKRQSGSSVRGQTRISKTGRASLRKILYMPAMAAKYYNPVVREFCDRLEDRGLRPIEATVAAMRKLLHIIYGVLKSGMPFDPLYEQKRQLDMAF
jgi:transposase